MSQQSSCALSTAGRHHPGMVGDSISERWAASNRNAGRHHVGILGGFARNPHGFARNPQATGRPRPMAASDRPRSCWCNPKQEATGIAESRYLTFGSRHLSRYLSASTSSEYAGEGWRRLAGAYAANTTSQDQ